MALDGLEATYLHDGSARRAMPVRVSLAEQTETAGQLGEHAGGRAGGQVVPLGELVRRDRVRAPFADLSQEPAAGRLRAGRHGLVDGNDIDSPLCSLIMRKRLQQTALPDTGELAVAFINQPQDPFGQYAIKWDGE
ncbi:MAG: hypothetical protein R3E68_14020 [Burkholderiaceae bacterium]